VVVLWSVALISLLLWLLAVAEVLPLGAWSYVFLVISGAFALTGLLRQRSGQRRP
jgi:hypothetical protein